VRFNKKNSVRSTWLLTYRLEDLTVLTVLTVLMVVFQKFCIAIHKNSSVNQLPPLLPPSVFDLHFVSRLWRDVEGRLRPEGRDLRLSLSGGERETY
jgi:hypothetical protein